jgi:hypothetical protein
LKSKTGKYFKYAIGEVVLVMIGILLALQVNNWNIVRIEHNEEKKLFLDLKSEFEKSLSLLTAWFRLIYTAMYFIALYNLLSILSIIKSIDHLDATAIGPINDSILIHFNTFRVEGSFGLIIFGIYLVLLGYLTYKATYVPKIFGVILFVAGLSWMIDNLSGFLFPGINTQFLFFFTMGELVFMLWLLIMGSRIKSVE